MPGNDDREMVTITLSRAALRWVRAALRIFLIRTELRTVMDGEPIRTGALAREAMDAFGVEYE